ncbi:MAG TPA: BlaI/MecI/CopY family transcriptional regulator [Flavitalea sp.]|nr:BlaI/MecI/CopY family transcriptional regulator [Flavitalea sp.]
MKTLTKAEEQVMQVLWKLERAFLRDIVEAMPAPKPHQNTVATILRILAEKKFAAINVMGRQHQYYTLVSKEEYSQSTIRQVVKNYFNGSFRNAVSFMVKEKNITLQELEILMTEIRNQQKLKK